MKNNKTTFIPAFILFLKGLFMGSADIVPGVSGGTIAFITGIYEQLITALKSINIHWLIYLIQSIGNKTYLKKSKKSFQSIQFSFLIPLALGVIVAFALLANIVSYFLDTIPTYTYAFFFGLILASSIHIYQINKKEFNITSIIFVIIGIIIGYLIVGFQQIQTEHTLIILFLCGIISFCAMILPGISGAFILLLLGQYAFMLQVLKGLTHGEWGNITYALVYGIGGIIGLIGFSRVLSYLIIHQRSITLSFIIGLMLGALRKPAQMIVETPANSVYIAISFIIGLSLVFIFSHYENKIKQLEST